MSTTAEQTYKELEQEISRRIWERLTLKSRRFTIWSRGGVFGLTVQTPRGGLAVHISQKGHFDSFDEAEKVGVGLGAGAFTRRPDEQWFLNKLGPKIEWEAKDA